MPGLYRIMMCFTPVIFVLMTWMYLEDDRSSLCGSQWVWVCSVLASRCHRDLGYALYR